MRVSCAYAFAAVAAAKSQSMQQYRGFSTWSLSAVTGSSVYGRDWLNETNVLAQSAALAASPLQQAWLARGNAVYFNIDSFWANSGGYDPVNAGPYWPVDTTRFPRGIRVIADAVHANGQRFGLYLNPGVARPAVDNKAPIPGVANCTADMISLGTPGNVFGDTYAVNWTHPCAQPYFDGWASLIVNEWGADFIKMDAVAPGSDALLPDTRQDVAAWSKALEATGKDVWLTISWHINASDTYLPQWAQSANAARTSDDVECYCTVLASWNSVVKRFTEVQPWLAFAASSPSILIRPDLDSLLVGQGDYDGLNIDQKFTMVTLWAITGSPLYTGNDLTQLDEFGVLLLTNPRVLSINEADILAQPLSADSPVWVANYGNGTAVVALFNLGDSAAAVSTPLSAVFPGATAGTVALLDVWSDIPAGNMPVSANVTVQLNAYGSRLLMAMLTA